MPVISHELDVVEAYAWYIAVSASAGAEQWTAAGRAGTGHPVLCASQAQQDYGAPLMDELDFLNAWKEGRIPFLGGMVRIRQIRRANLAQDGQLASSGW